MLPWATEFLVHAKLARQNYLPEKRLEPVSSLSIDIMYSEVAENTI